MADPGCGGPISPCPRAAPRRSCSPSPTALGLWLGPRSAAAGPPAPPPDEHTKHHFFSLVFWICTGKAVGLAENFKSEMSHIHLTKVVRVAF